MNKEMAGMRKAQMFTPKNPPLWWTFQVEYSPLFQTLLAMSIGGMAEVIPLRPPEPLEEQRG